MPTEWPTVTADITWMIWTHLDFPWNLLSCIIQRTVPLSPSSLARIEGLNYNRSLYLHSNQLIVWNLLYFLYLSPFPSLHSHHHCFCLKPHGFYLDCCKSLIIDPRVLVSTLQINPFELPWHLLWMSSCFS